MTTYTLRAGMTLDIPSADDVAQITRDEFRRYDEHERSKARTMKRIRRAGPGPSPAASTFFLGVGPEVGYVWSLKLLSFVLASAGTAQAYVASSAPSTSATPLLLIAQYGTSGTNQVATWSSDQVELVGGESVYIVASQSINTFCLMAHEAAAEQGYKIYD